MPLAPEIQKYLDIQVAAGLPAAWEAPIDVIRAYTQGRIKMAGPAEPILKVENRYIAGPTSDLHIRIYTPTASKNQPALIYFHGGGWVLNFIDIYDAALHRIANQSGAVVVAVNYQKAPEHPFPTPFNDCFATLEWVIKNAESLNIDSHKIGVGGESAGANLAAAVALKTRDLEIKLAVQLLVYPCLDRDFSTSSYSEFATGFGLTTQAMQWYWDQYLQGERHDDNPYACPARAKTIKSLAPAIIVTAQYDPLVSDSEKYVQLLKSDGVHVEARNFDGMVHGFFSNVAVTPTSTVALDFCAEQIKQITA